MAHSNMSAATLALIAETEETTAKELPPAHLALTIQRAFDQAGQPIPRRFICSTNLLGRVITSTAGTQFAAHTGLQRQIRMLGYEPVWTAFNDLTVLVQHPDDEPEQLSLPISEPEDTAESSEPAEEPGEHEDPAYGLVVAIPALDKSGWLTPLSDPLAYKRVYLAAWKLATGFTVYSISDVTAESRNVRAAVAAVMMSGDAGESIGVPAKAVDPWALGTNGEREMCWVRVAKGTPDPTTKPFRPGNGVAREAYLMTLSNRLAFPDRAEGMRVWRERKAARRYVGTKGTATTVPQKDERDIKRGQAHAAGQAAKGIAFANGSDSITAERDYKWVYCATLRNLGEVHAEYERQLADAGISEQDILEYCEMQKTA
jgi:DUF971 family protein